jgi:release factor glutamine methyltransferase
MRSQGKKVFFGRYVFEVFKQVYEPAEDTFLLARSLIVEEGARVLDMGTGCGILAVLAAEKARGVVALDISPKAAACAKSNAEANGMTAKIEICCSDLFKALRDAEKFDLILFNAPYLPVKTDEGDAWIEKAWAGGKTGRDVIERFVNHASRHLAKNGRILMVQSSLSNVEETLEQFSLSMLCATIVAEEKTAFEKIVVIEAKQR